MSEELKRELQSERDGWRYRASFWKAVAELSATRNVMEGLEPGPDTEVLATIVRSYIFTGLETGFFSSQQPTANGNPLDELLDEKIQETIPWSVAVESAEAVGVDAEEVLRDYIEHAQEGLRHALEIAGQYIGQREDMLYPHFAGIPITEEMAQEIMRGEFGQAFDQAFADKYIAHVMHGDRPCKHPYDSVDEALEGLAYDLERGEISAVNELSYKGEPLLSYDELMRRINEINSAGLN